jgi:hypothetical protein
MRSENILTLNQIAVLARCSERGVVRKDMREGKLPSQGLDDVREWLHLRWESEIKELIRNGIPKLD